MEAEKPIEANDYQSKETQKLLRELKEQSLEATAK
jgi:hypothetical protein